MWNIVAFVFDLADKNSRPSLYLFSDQNGAKNPTFWGGTYPYGLYKEVPPPPAYPGQILSLEILKALVTLEQVNTSVVKKKRRILRTKTSIVRLVCCRKLSLYANESCDEHAYYFFRRWLRCRTMFITFWSLEIMSRPLIFVYLYHTC